MRSEERLLALAIPIGFIAFTLPLLYSDTRHLWATPKPPDAPPPPPPWHQYEAQADTPSGKFRVAVSAGDLPAAEALVAEHGAALVNEDHWHGNTPLFEAARAGHEEMVK